MAEEKSPGKVSGWIKAGVTSIMGLLSGAVLMYVSPLVTNAIKPPKPLANFGQNSQGLTVTFQNRATNASNGWWDFGDGSPLEPFSPKLDTVNHTYAHTGTFNVKLTLRNFLGEENERTAPVILEESTAGNPVIEAFKVVPIKLDAPATYKVVSQIKNADFCVWSLGDDRPLEISHDKSLNQERYVTIKEPGYYNIRLAASSNGITTERSESIFVNVGDNAAPGVSLQVTYQAIPIERKSKPVTLHTAFPADNKDQAYPFSIFHMEPYFQIASAKFDKPVKDPHVKNPELTISPDKSKVTVTGELVKPSGIMAWQKNQPHLNWSPVLVLGLEHRSPSVMKSFDPVAANLVLPGTTILPLPRLYEHWEIKGRSFNLEMHDGPALVFKDSHLPISALVQFKNHPYRITATQGVDSIRLDATDAKDTLRPIGN